MFDFSVADLSGPAPEHGSEKRSILNLALDNFESALCLLDRLQPDTIGTSASQMLSASPTSDQDLTSLETRCNLCMNIALIRAHFSDNDEAVIMMEKACEIKKEQANEDPNQAKYDQLRDMLILLAHQQ